MRERPILFSAPMVNALRDDRKTQTRRALKSQGWDAILPSDDHAGEWVPWKDGEAYPSFICPYGEPGDRLYVRETFRFDVAYDNLKPSAVGERAAIWYEAGGAVGNGVSGKTRVSIHMPRWASRLVLEITDVGVERLQAITEADAKREGATFHDGRGIGHSGWRHDLRDVHADARSSFARLWREINGAASWDENPFVWVVGFKRVM